MLETLKRLDYPLRRQVTGEPARRSSYPGKYLLRTFPDLRSVTVCERRHDKSGDFDIGWRGLAVYDRHRI